MTTSIETQKYVIHNNSILDEFTRDYNNMIDIRFNNTKLVVIKVTNRCNLNCLYCYENVNQYIDMPLGVFYLLIDKVLCSTVHKRVNFLFHGGEPSLLPVEWYCDAVDYACTRAKSLNKEISFSMQTNLLGLDSFKVGIYKDLGIKIGASLDGNSTMDKPLRKRNDLAIKKYLMIVKQGITPGILMTINHSNYDRFPEICKWLESDLRAKTFKANPVSSVGRGINLPDLEAGNIFAAYRDIVEYMIETKGEKVIEDNVARELIMFFSSVEERRQMPQEICRTQICGAGISVISITPEGNIIPCGRFQSNETKYFLGTLNSRYKQSDANIYRASLENSAITPETRNVCTFCTANAICNFGCHAFVVRSKNKINIDCLPTKMRFDYYLNNQMRLLPIANTIKQKNIIRGIGLKGKLEINQQILNDYSDGYSDYSDYNDYSDSRY